MKTVVASLFACAVLAHSPQLLAQAAAPEIAAPKAAPSVSPAAADDAAEPAHDAAHDAAQNAAHDAAHDAANAGDGEGGADSAPASEKHDIGTSRLEGALHKVEQERAEYSRLLPWLTVGVGAALTLGGTAVGAGYVFGCKNDCATPAWPGLLVVAGTLVATLGTIWVVRANADVREIDSKHYQLEQELERIRFSANLPNKSDLQRSQMLSMSFAFR